MPADRRPLELRRLQLREQVEIGERVLERRRVPEFRAATTRRPRGCAAGSWAPRAKSHGSNRPPCSPPNPRAALSGSTDARLGQRPAGDLPNAEGSGLRRRGPFDLSTPALTGGLGGSRFGDRFWGQVSGVAGPLRASRGASSSLARIERLAGKDGKECHEEGPPQ